MIRSRSVGDGSCEVVSLNEDDVQPNVPASAPPDNRINHHMQQLTMHNPKDHITFRKNIRNIKMIRMRTSVNDTVHIQVQMVKLGKQGLIGDDLVDFWITLTEPSVELVFGGAICDWISNVDGERVIIS